MDIQEQMSKRGVLSNCLSLNEVAKENLRDIAVAIVIGLNSYSDRVLVVLIIDIDPFQFVQPLAMVTLLTMLTNSGGQSRSDQLKKIFLPDFLIASLLWETQIMTNFVTWESPSTDVSTN